MGMASKIFIIVTVMNLWLFVLFNFGGIGLDGRIGGGYVNSDGDIFSTGIINQPNMSNPALQENFNGTIMADIENNLEPNSAWQYSTISFGWTMVKQIFKILFGFITMPVQVFSVEYGFPSTISFILQTMIGLPIVIAYIISLGMLIFGRSQWD